MKKTLALLLALVTLLSVCSLTALAEETLEPVTIKMAIWDIPVLCESSDDFTKEDGKYYDARWAYMAEKFNVRFEYVPLEYNTHQEKLRIMINGDDMPDVGSRFSEQDFRQALTVGHISSVTLFAKCHHGWD